MPALGGRWSRPVEVRATTRHDEIGRRGDPRATVMVAGASIAFPEAGCAGRCGAPSRRRGCWRATVVSPPVPDVSRRLGLRDRNPNGHGFASLIPSARRRDTTPCRPRPPRPRRRPRTGRRPPRDRRPPVRRRATPRLQGGDGPLAGARRRRRCATTAHRAALDVSNAVQTRAIASRTASRSIPGVGTYRQGIIPLSRDNPPERKRAPRRRLLLRAAQQPPPDVPPPGRSAIEIASARNASPSPPSSRSMNTWTLIRFPVPSATRKVPTSRNSPTVAMPAA